MAVAESSPSFPRAPPDAGVESDAAPSQSELNEVRLRVFISYSRKDVAFAEELLEALEQSGFDVLIDRHSLDPGADWQARLGDLILGSDTVVFVLSPDSVNSEVCDWEVMRAIEYSKRILPVVSRPVDFSGKVPLRLKQINAIPMDELRSISGLAKLVEALKSDVGWLRHHTDLGERAEEWLAAGRDEGRLLRGSKLKEARTWLDSKPRNAPDPTKLQREFITASDVAEAENAKNKALFDELLAERAAKQRAQERADSEQAAKEIAEKRAVDTERRRRRVATALAYVFLVSGAFAVAAAWNAVKQRSIAEAQRTIAEREKQEAQAQKSIAVAAQAALDEKNRGLEKGILDLNSRLCKEAISATTGLASGVDTAKWDTDFSIFWTLYNGPMIGLETLERASGHGRSDVASAMVAFGNQLGGPDDEVQTARASGLPRTDLAGLANSLKIACERLTRVPSKFE